MPRRAITKWCIPPKREWPEGKLRVVTDDDIRTVVIDMPIPTRHRGLDTVLKLARRIVSQHNAPLIQRAKAGAAARITNQRKKQDEQNESKRRWHFRNPNDFVL